MHNKQLYTVLRWFIMLSVLAYFIIGFLFYNRGSDDSGYTILPITNALSPFGAFYSLLLTVSGGIFQEGVFIERINNYTYAIFAVMFGAALLLGRTFCGYICPFGTIQEIFSNIGSKLFPNFKKKFNNPDNTINKYGKFIKFIILAAIIIVVLITGKFTWLFWADPWIAFGNIFSPWWLIMYIGGLFVLITSLFMCFVYPRFFCRFLCPSGAIYSLLAKISPLRVEKSICEEGCGDCKSCGVCPVDIDLAKDKLPMEDCIRCGKCINETNSEVFSYRIFGLKPRLDRAIVLVICAHAIVLPFIFLYINIAKTPQALIRCNYINPPSPAIERQRMLGERARIDGFLPQAYKKRLGLSNDILIFSSDYEVVDKTPVKCNYDIAQNLTGISWENYLEQQGYPNTTTPQTLTGEVKRQITFEKFCEVSGNDYFLFKSEANLPDSVTKDTKFGEVIDLVRDFTQSVIQKLEPFFIK